MKLILTFTIQVLVSSASVCIGQSIDTLLYYYENQLIDEFIVKFNGDFDPYTTQGNSLETDQLNRQRVFYSLLNLEDSTLVYSETTKSFSKFYLNDTTLQLNIFDSSVYSIVTTNAIFNKKKTNITLTLKPHGNPKTGYKWLISNVAGDIFTIKIPQDSLLPITPNNHEVNFLSLYKIFNITRYSDLYLDNNRNKETNLAMLAFCIENGLIEMKAINKPTFYFTQFDGYIISISEYKRETFNSGWLISSIIPCTEIEKQMLIQNLQSKFE